MIRRQRHSSRGRRRPMAAAAMATVLGLTTAVLPAVANAAGDGYGDPDDVRYSLEAGFEDAETASMGMEQVDHIRKADTGFFNPGNIGSIGYANSDMAFTRGHLIQGNYRGFQIYDTSDPTSISLRTTMLCPGGQGDVNVYGNLLFQSVEDNAGRVDCGDQGNGSGASDERFRGVRIWDISDLDNPVQLAGIQLCRGSHTNRLVEDPNDDSVVYVYNEGTSSQRSADEKVHTPQGFLDGRCGQMDPEVENPSAWMIEIIKVPLNNPAAAEVVNEARLFADSETGAVNGLQNGPTRPTHPCADENECSPAFPFYSPSPNTNTCHDITAYPEIGLAAGACQGNGLLIDISDPANPQRVDAVADENFAYWHSANFSNDGSKVMFTDEWGGGVGARCAPNHRTSWGANAIFTIDRSGEAPKLEFVDYYKLPAAQQDTENCVAHQGNLLPVPGRDIVVQAWYQGGISVLDMTDPANPFEVAYFDRGPIDANRGVLGGFWSAYWSNGAIYGSEIARGVDALELTPTEKLSENEIAVAKTVQLEEHNAMAMRSYSFEPSFTLVRAYRDQLARTDVDPALIDKIDKYVDRAEEFTSGSKNHGKAKGKAKVQAAKSTLRDLADQLTGPGQEDLAQALGDLADSL